MTVIIRAAKGAKVWSAGLDITELPQPGVDPLSYGDPLEKMLREVERFPAPVIAMIEGSVWGGACDLAFVCDIIIGAPNVTFAITPAKIGVPYNSSGIMHFINVVGMHIAKEMFFTAQPVDAERALQIGIMNHLVPGWRNWKASPTIWPKRSCQNSPFEHFRGQGATAHPGQAPTP